MAEPIPANAAQSTSESQIRFIESGEAEAMSATEILTWAIKNFHPRIALACSFGAPEGLAVLDMLHRIEPGSRVFVLDTGRLPQATYDLIDRVRDRYGKSIEVVFPRSQAVESMVREGGFNLFYESVDSRQLCCRVRKVEPLNRHLSGLDAWITGLRREQTENRSDARKIEIDAGHGGIVKVNPIADWSQDEVWSYVRGHDVPVNRLHAEGYPSVGCAPCSRAVAPGADPRSGRWWWEQDGNSECGIHTEEEQGSGI
jgi:thioredoxin-dependent adenylylsulfate APS reductase